MELVTIKNIIEFLLEAGVQITIVAMVIVIAYKYVNKKLFSEENIQRERDINDKLDAEENEKSRKKIRDVQKYLEKHSQEFFDAGIDRVNIWLNHNGTRKGKVHFLYYSLVAEIVKPGLEKFSQFEMKLEKLPYYMFSEYEQRVIEGEGCFFAPDVNELGHTASAIAKDTGAKSMCIKGIYNTSGNIDGLIFGSAVFNKLEKAPDLHKHIENIRVLFIG